MILRGTNGARGVLETGYVFDQSNGASLIFDGGILRATGTIANFLPGFADGEVVINGGGAFIDTNGFDIGFATGLQGAGGLTKVGNGTLTLSGANAQTGGTTINAGVLTFGVGGTLGAATGTTTVIGGTLDFSGTTQTQGMLDQSGGTVRSGTMNAGTYRLTGGTLAETATINAGAFDLRAGAVNGVLGGGGALTKTSSGTVTLAAANTYTGGTTISGGVLNVRNNTALGFGAVTVNGGALELQGGVTVGNGLTLNGTGVSNGGALRSVSGSNTYGGPIILVGDASIVSAAGTLAFNAGGVISGGAFALTLGGDGNGAATAAPISAGTLIKEGAGMWTIGNAGNAISLTTVNAGILQLTTQYSNANSAAVVVNAPGTLQVTNSMMIGSLAGGGRVTLQGPAETLTTGGDNNSTIFSGEISEAGGVGSLVKTGTGTFTQSGSSTYSGDTTVSGGALIVDGGSISHPVGSVFVGDQAGDSGTMTILNGGVVNAERGLIAINDGRGSVAVSGAGSLLNVSDSLGVGSSGEARLDITAGGAVSVGDALVIGVAELAQGQVTVSGTGSSLTVDGNLLVSSNGAGSLVVSGGGTVSSMFGSLGSFTPGTDGDVLVTGAGSRWDIEDALIVGINGTGTVSVAAGGVLSASGITLADGADATGTLNIGAAAGDLAAAVGTLDAATVAFGAGTGTINFNHTGTDYEFASAISGNGTINQVAGTTVLTGTSSNTGANNVRGGTLLVNGTLGVTATTVVDGAKLGGSGSIGGDVTIADGGILAPGSSAGTLTLGSLSLNGGSILDYELGQAGVVGGGVNDLIVVTGDLALDGTLNITDIGSFGPGVYRLMNYGGALTDNGLELGGLPTGVDAGDLFVQTRIAGQVNLNNSVGAELGFWDGGNAALHDNGINEGGSGVWDATNRNWTEADGVLNGQWNQDFAIFGGAAGTVTVDDAAGGVFFTGMQFMTNGYVVDGDALTANTGETIIRTDAGVTATIAAAIDGSGGLVKQDTGTLILSGINSYTGGTSIRNGTLQVSADANLGAASGGLTLDGGTLRLAGVAAPLVTGRNVTLGAGGGTFYTVDLDMRIAGDITGPGALTKSGDRNLLLLGDSSYSGGTVVNGGTLALGDATNTAAIVGNAFITNGNLIVTNADTSGITSISVGKQGGLIFEGTSTASSISMTVGDFAAILFDDQSTAGSATIANTGSNTADGNGTSFLDDSSAGNATIITDHAQVDFVDRATAANASITSNAEGLVRFLGTSSGGNARFVTNAGGRFDISQLASAGTTAGSIEGAGSYFLGSRTLSVGSNNRSTEVAGVISDGGLGGGTGGALAKVGTGTLTLTGANTYSGGTTINAGTLQLGNGGVTGSFAGDVDIANDGTLAFNRSDSFIFAGLIAGDGTVEKLAGGTLTLTGNSNAFAGTTTVNAGTLAVNGTLGGTLEVLAAARLQGTGTVGTTTVAAGGTIAPGSSIGTLRIAGDYTQRAGSTYEAEIATDGESDLIDVTGAATIEGGTVFAFKAPGGYDVGTRYTILTADSVTGTYNTLDQNAPFVDLALAYNPKAIYLDVTRNDVSFCDVAITANQCAIGDGVDSQGPGTLIYDAIVGLPDDETARDAFDQLSGEMHASIKGAMLEDSRLLREAATARVRAAFAGTTARPLPVMGYGPEEALAREGKSANVFAPTSSDTDRFAVWVQGLGSWGEWDGDGNAAALDRSIGGLLIGADGLVTETWRLGVVAGYSHSSFDLDRRASSGDSDDYHLGLYGGTQWGALGFRAGAAYTWHSIETVRSVAFPGVSDQLSADYDAGTTQVFGELGYKVDHGSFAFEPFGNLAYVNVHTDGFNENGGAAALTTPSSGTDVTFTTLGLRASTGFGIGAIQATASGMVGWRHALGDVTPLSSFAFAGSNAFTIAGTPIAEDAVLLEAGLDFSLSAKASLGVSYSGQIASNAGDHAFRADFSVKF